MSSGGTDQYAYYAAAWIDYDHSGTFDATDSFGLSESVLLSGETGYGVTTTASFVVPDTVKPGLTGMRVRSLIYFEGSFSSSSACDEDYDPGYVQDYVININAGTPCSGTPVAGVPYSNPGYTCPGSSTHITIINPADSGILGLTYQWYSSPSGAGSYTAMSGSGATSYVNNTAYQDTASDYYVVATCTASGDSASSSVVTVGNSPFYLCYCQPVLGSPLSS